MTATPIAPARERPANVKELVLLALIALCLLAPGLGSFPPIDRDEPRYATATTQMLDTGNFVDIRYQDLPRYLQPAGVYWLQAIPSAVFGSHDHRAIWTFRMPSLLGAVLAVLVTGWAASRLFGRSIGISAAALLAGCMSLGFEARIGKTDAALLGAITVAQFGLMRAYLGGALPRWAAATFWIAVGAGVLLKGPVVLMVCGLTAVVLCLLDRKARWLLGLRPAWGVPLMLVVALPWYLAIGAVSHGLFFKIAVGKSMLDKVGHGQQAHGAPPGYHLALFPITFWPSSLLMVAAAPFAWANRKRGEVRFLLAWIIPSWIAFELFKTKLPHYVLPTFPALALLSALALFRPAPFRSAWRPTPLWLRIVGVVFVALWAVVSAVLAALPAAALAMYENRTDLVALLLGVAAAGAASAFAVYALRQRPDRAVMAATTASLLVMLNLYVVGLPGLNTFWLSPRAEQAVQAVRPCPAINPVLVSTPYHEPSLVFLHGPTRTVLAENASEAADDFAKAGACAVAMTGEKETPVFLARAAALGLAVRPLGSLYGRDYADGRNLTLTFYGLAGRR